MKYKKYDPSKDSSTETFFTRNVRTITFLICMAVFLAVAGPWSFFRIRDAIYEYQESKREPMTVADVIQLSEYTRDVFLSDVDKFKGERSNWTNEIHYTVEIEDKYLLYVVAEPNTQKILYATLTHLDCVEEEYESKMADVLKKDIATFIHQHNNEKGQ